MASRSSAMRRKSMSFPEMSMEKYPGFSVGIKTTLREPMRLHLANVRAGRRILTRQQRSRPKRGSTVEQTWSDGIQHTSSIVIILLFRAPALQPGQ